MTYGDTLQDARNLLCGVRDLERGDPLPVYETAAKVAAVLTGKGHTAGDVLLIMAAVKWARQRCCKDNPDNIVDLVAYLDIYAYWLYSQKGFLDEAKETPTGLPARSRRTTARSVGSRWHLFRHTVNDWPVVDHARAVYRWIARRR